MATLLPAEWSVLLRCQAGVVSHQQLRAQGLTDHGILAQLSARRWQRPHPRVYATTTGPLSLDAKRWAALLYAGHGAVLGYQTAAALWGLTTEPVLLPVHLVVPYARSVVRQPGLVIHRTRRPLIAVGTPPCTSAETTVCDLAGKARRLADALAPVARGIQVGAVNPAELLAELDRRMRQRWKLHLAAAVTDASNGSHSLLELYYHRDVECAHGLPPGIRQRSVSRTKQDVYYKIARLITELDGLLGHDQPDQRWRDMHRDNAALLRGESTLRFGWADVAGDPCGVAAQVAAALRRGGWSGSPHPCGPHCPLVHLRADLPRL